MLVPRLALLVGLALRLPLPDNQPPTGPIEGPSVELTTALQGASVAEIYIIEQIEFPMTPTPDMVRQSGCKYLVLRRTPTWRDLEESLRRARMRLRATTTRVVSRIGLVLSDERGT